MFISTNDHPCRRSMTLGRFSREGTWWDEKRREVGQAVREGIYSQRFNVSLSIFLILSK